MKPGTDGASLMGDLMRPQDVATKLRLSRACVYDLLSSGQLPSYRFGVGRGTYRVSQDHLLQFLKQSEHSKSPAASFIK